MITIIAAVSENNALGKDNGLIWHLPEDLKRFKKLTNNHCIIMGRKTFESLPKMHPLPNRHNIVITRNKDFKIDDVTICHSIEEALKVSSYDNQPFIIGGGEIYKLAMKFTKKIELTKIYKTFDADTFFPKIDENKWKLVEEKFHKKNDINNFNFSYLTYLKKNK